MPENVVAILPELYDGIAKGAFPYFGADDLRSSAEAGRHLRWAAAVRAAGYTIDGIREAGESDPDYQKWLAFQDHKARVLSQALSPGRRRK